MMLLGSKNKVIIDITTGEKLGYLKNCDIDIDEKNGVIKSLIIPKSKLNAIFMQQDDYIEILWSKIIKIGTDTILVKL